MRLVTHEEVKEALFQMRATKAPGPDGLSGLFYHHQGDIQHDVFKLVDSFVVSGTFDPSLNRTHIILILKVANPKSITHYMLISLCNFNYKIVSKVMASRLKPWLPKSITTEQSAFVSGKQIKDNIFIVQEVLHQLKIWHRKRKFQTILKLDMQKVHDNVEWDFLCICMLKLMENLSNNLNHFKELNKVILSPLIYLSLWPMSFLR